MPIKFPLVAYYLDDKSLKKVDSLTLQAEEVRAFIAKKNREYACSRNLYTGSLYNQNTVLIDEFTELADSKLKTYPQLIAALECCKAKRAELVIARVMSVYRNKAFTNLLLKYNVPFHCLEVKTLTLASLQTVLDMYTMMKKRQSMVIKHALQAARKPLGNPNALQEISKVNKPKRENAIMFSILLSPIIDYYRSVPQNYSQRKIVKELNNNGYAAPEGGNWVLSQIQKVLDRIDMNNFVMSISQELEYCRKKGYTKSQVMKVLKALNLDIPGKQILDELFIDKILERHAILIDITSFNVFIAKYLPKMLEHIEHKGQLVSLVKELNERKVPIPGRVQWEWDVSKNNKQASSEQLQYWTTSILEVTISAAERRKRDIEKIVNRNILEESKRLIEQVES